MVFTCGRYEHLTVGKESACQGCGSVEKEYVIKTHHIRWILQVDFVSHISVRAIKDSSPLKFRIRQVWRKLIPRWPKQGIYPLTTATVWIRMAKLSHNRPCNDRQLSSEAWFDEGTVIPYLSEHDFQGTVPIVEVNAARHEQ